MRRVLLGGAALAFAGLKAFGMRELRRARSAYPPVGDFVAANGCRLHFLMRGTGQPVVLLHGGGLVLQDFTFSIFDRIAHRYQAIAFDRPGYGYSERPRRAPLTLALNAQLLHEALDRLDVARPILIGHSSGASVALRYALEYPDALTGLLLLAPSAFDSSLSAPRLSWLTRTPMVGFLFRHALQAPLARFAAPMFVGGLFAPGSPPPGYEDMLAAFVMRREHFESWAEELDHLRVGLREQSPWYGDVHVPVAILAGQADREDPPEAQALRLQRAIPRARLVTLRRVGHAVHHQNPRAVLRALGRVRVRTSRW